MAVKRAIAVWTLGMLGAIAAPLQAAELSTEGTRLVVAGTLDDDGARAVAEQLAGGKIRTVVFEDSTGGHPVAAEGYVQAIRQAGVNTEARGACHDACAFAFLAGREHRFGRGLHVSSLLVPLPRRVPEAEIEKTLAEFMAAPMAAHAAGAPSGPWQPSQGLLVTSTPTLFGRVSKSYWCDGTQGRDPSKCAPLDDADPYKLGLLTP